MPEIRYLSIRYANELNSREIPFFRSAVIEKTKRKASLFHNHKDDKQYHYRYPLIQYKLAKDKASIICINEGTDDIHQLLQQRDMRLRIGKQVQDFKIEDLQLNYQTLTSGTAMQSYKIRNWMAFNQQHHQRFKELEGDQAAQTQLLADILRGNLLSFAKGIKWYVEDRIVVEIDRVYSSRIQPFKGNKVLTFDLLFRTNMALPNWIGLGKGVSVGFGVVFGVKKNRKNIKSNNG